MEPKAEYVVSTEIHGREFKCTCGHLLGYLRNAGNWVVLLTVDGYLVKGEAWIPCPDKDCGKHRQFKRWARSVPAFLDETRNIEAEATAVLLAEARRLASK